MFNRNVGTAAVPGSYVDTDESAGPRWRRHAVVPAGVEIVVRTIDPIDVREPEPHRMFPPGSTGTYGMPADGS